MEHKYLICETEYIFDGTGDDVTGKETYFLTNDDLYRHISRWDYYKDLSECNGVEDLPYFEVPEGDIIAPDCGHIKVYSYEYCELKPLEAARISIILDDYSRLKQLM